MGARGPWLVELGSSRCRSWDRLQLSARRLLGHTSRSRGYSRGRLADGRLRSPPRLSAAPVPNLLLASYLLPPKHEPAGRQGDPWLILGSTSRLQSPPLAIGSGPGLALSQIPHRGCL